jgi:hypothetical protein
MARGRTRHGGMFVRSSALNLHGHHVRTLKPVVVTRSGPAPAFTKPFVMSKMDQELVELAELVEAVEHVQGANRRVLFLQREAVKKAQVEAEEKALMERLSTYPTYGRRGLINARFRLRGRYYPTFAPYFEKRVGLLTTLNAQPKRVAEKEAYMDELEAELDSWTFKVE